MMSFNRRDFLKGTVAGSVLAASNLSANTSSQKSGVQEDKFDPQYNGLINYHNELTSKFISESVSKQEYDVIVIGSGMGGGTLANLLSNNGIKTLVLEAGTLLLQTNVNNLPGANLFKWFQFLTQNFDSLTPDTTGFLPTYIGLGGKSAVWTGIIPRYKGWELDYFPQEIKKYLLNNDGYAIAENILLKQVTRGPFEDEILNQSLILKILILVSDSDF
jgi:hypothetical protein